MAVVQQGTPSVYENAAAVSAVIPYPTGITAGELLVAHITNSNATADTTAVSGWTMAKAQNGPSSSPSTSVWYKIATGSESGSVTFPTGTSGRVTGIMERWSGVDNTTPMDAIAVSASSGIASTFNTPTITTVTDNAMLIHTVSINASSSADIDTPAGMTLVSGSTGTGRRQRVFSEVKTPAGATGTKTFTLNPTTPTLQWSGITIALRPSGGAPATPTLNSCVNDIPGTTTMSVAVNTSNATSVRLKVGTDTGLTTGVIFGSAVTPDANNYSQLSVSGLTANTRYYYRVAMTDTGSTESLDTMTQVGTFKTDSNSAINFTVGFGSCTNNTDSNAMGAIATKQPDLFLHLGDEYYADASGTGIANFRAKMLAKKQATNHAKVFRTSGSSIVPSDHDGMNNNGNAGSDATAWTNYNTAYREINPNSDLPSVGIYRSFKRGRVRFIRIDRRSEATIATATDNSSKTSLGATQKAWLKAQIDAATEPLIIIQNPDPWVTSATASDDGWAGYITERNEIADYMTASGKNFIVLAGDMHALAADDGTSTNNRGGHYMFAASPFYQNASQKGGPYSTGPYPASGTAIVEQYGWIDITDDGSTITATFTGYSADNTSRVTLTKTVVTDLVVSPSGIGSSEAWGAPSNTLDVTNNPTAITTSEAFGTPSNTLDLTVNPTGIATGEAFGAIIITYGALSATPNGIVSAEAFGNPSNSIAGGDIIYTPDGIVSGEVWGAASNTYGAVSNTPDGIVSGEAFGVTKIFMGNSMVLPKPLSDYSTGDLEYEFYRRQSGLSQGTFNDHKYNFMRNELGGTIEGTLDDIEYEYWKSRSGLTGKRFSLADHRIATFEQTNPGGFNDDGRTYFSQFFS